MPKAVFYHNPRCSKSRQALQYLQAQNIEMKVVEYLKEGLKIDEVKALHEALNVDDASLMIRHKEAEYKLAELNKQSTTQDILQALVDYPKLLERPILLVGNKAAIGRPLENIQAIVND
jgi:arsenate reductase